jgi:hypothetical protein
MQNHFCALVALAALASISSAQVSPDAGADQDIAFGSSAALAGVLNNRSPLDFWTADGNLATENCILMYRDGQPLGVSPPLHDAANHVFGWPSDLIPINGQIYGIESYRRSLYTVDVQTGLCSAIGPQNTWHDVYSLAYDAAGDRLFGVDLLKKQLLKFNRTTGVVTKVGAQTLKGYYLIRALAFRPSNGLLYAIDQGKSQLITINPVTGVPTFVRQFPKIATQRVEELEFYNDQLYASLGLMNLAGDLIAGQMQKIDLTTFNITNLGPIIQDCSPHSLVINSLPEEFSWSVQSGPGTVTFSDARSLTSNATFSAPGAYELVLTAFAVTGPVSDTLTVNVN